VNKIHPISRSILVCALLIVGTGHAYVTKVPDQEARLYGDLIKGEITPNRSFYVFTVQRGPRSKIIGDYDSRRGDKIRLSGFGLTEFGVVQKLMKEVGANVSLRLPSGQMLWILKTDKGDLKDDNFELELDRTGLIQTFADDFKEFSWYTEGLPQGPIGGGKWRTNFGYAGAQDIGSRTLASNRELQIYVDKGFRGTSMKSLGINPFRITDGALNIIADRAPENIRPYIWNYEYTSGLITSQFSFSQLYGVFEMRARIPKGRGLWSCFWLLPTDHTWPPEVDVFEILGDETTVLHTNAHSNITGKHTDAPGLARVQDTATDFHLYAVDWRKDEIRWYFDGVEVARVPTPGDLHKPLYILANLGIGGWRGPPDQSTHFPATFAIDWIHVYKRVRQE
jgi:hypothetical protein